jgi:hypothetical protein
VIWFPVGDESGAYVHYIGYGIHGDAVRVLPGLYSDELSAQQVVDLASQQERFIAQTFVLSVLDVPGAHVVSVLETRPASELAPWWCSGPIPDRFEDRWIIGLDRETHYQMGDFVKAHPEVDPTNLPDTGVYGEGLLQELIRVAWRPADGRFRLTE